MANQPMDMNVIEIMRSYDLRDYLYGEDLQNYDTYEQLQSDLQNTQIEAALFYERAVHFLNLPPDYMSEKNADLGIMFELSAYAEVLRHKAASAFGATYKKYTREAFKLLSEALTQIILSQRKVMEREASKYSISMSIIRARMEAGMIRTLPLTKSEVLAELSEHPFTDVELLTNYGKMFFGTDELCHLLMLNNEHLFEVLQHAGGTWPQRWQDKQNKLLADKWTIKPREHKKQSYSVPKANLLTMQNTAQPADYLFDRGTNNAQLINTGAAQFNAKTPTGDAITCTIMLSNDEHDDMYDPQIDCIQPRFRPVYSAIEAISNQHLAEGKNPNVIPIPLGSILRKMQGNPKRRIDDDMMQQIREAVECMMRQPVWIDCTEEARAYDFDAAEFAVYEPILDGRLLKVSVHGHDTLTLILDRPPILFRYALACSKYIMHDERYTLGGMKNLGMGAMAERDYLARRILIAYRMDSDKRKKDKRKKFDTPGIITLTIRLNTTAEVLGVDPHDIPQIRRLRENAQKFLDAWSKPDDIANDHFQLIEKYELQKSGRKTTGFIVHLLPRDIASFQRAPESCQTLDMP